MTTSPFQSLLQSGAVPVPANDDQEQLSLNDMIAGIFKQPSGPPASEAKNWPIDSIGSAPTVGGYSGSGAPVPAERRYLYQAGRHAANEPALLRRLERQRNGSFSEER
jgi:hypothetical protein